MSNTIKIKGECITKEAEAAAAITPGHLVELDSAGKVQVQSTAGAAAQRAFALENDLIGGAVGDAYATGGTVKYGIFEPGAEVYAFLDGGENVAIGATLVPAGDGSLIAETSFEAGAVCAIAKEAVDNSSESAGGAQARITVEVV